MEEVLQTVGLMGTADQKVKTYSLGMKQRLGIAQALLGNQKVVILDEPANGLDPMGIRELRELIIRLRDQKGLTFFISSHLLDELEQMCNRLVVVRKGRLVWQGRMEDLSGNDGWVYTVSKADQALAVLSGKVAVKQLSPNRLEVQVGENKIDEINRLLMQHNVRVLGIEKKQKKLEDLFIEWVSS
ncbi:ATP-binding cassette domain-containing protein [Polycladomyces subterraneus]|uniref:ABC transporter ATP-binding protein n=1 Tax=Polycladomyces subterraneus TaxID=1016997 RepID=A0ABT8IIS2_9BACL|nr:ABC transporter ATP-binding protein [Polycladomyces subterraneus]MDN4592686.1 ABC transporter ATP-binding protein [Polycladomyces subterraneus]